MTVRVYDARTAVLLGSFPSATAAYAAADEHAIAAVEAAGTWLLLDYLYIYDAGEGELHVGAELTHLGPPGDPEGCREWLRQLPGRGA